MKYKKRKVYIMTKFEGFDYESVLKKITALPEGILSAILKEYTLDRYDHSLKDPQTKQEKYLARYEIERIKKSTKTYIMTKFPDSTLEEVLKILSSLPGGY